MSRPPSLLSRVITATAQRLADHPSVPVHARQAFVQTAESVMHAQWADMFGGENVWVRIYAPHNNSTARQQRRVRIEMAIKRGEPASEIAKREGVTERWVYKIGKLNCPRVESSPQVGEHPRGQSAGSIEEHQP